MKWRFGAALLAACLAGSALAGQKSPVAAPRLQATELPPYTPAYEPRTVDERGLWMEADEFERQMQGSPLVIRDEALNSHIHEVLCSTVGKDRCKSVRIYVVRMPAFNASMRPNGMMTIWSGLLMRIKNDAELGSVLGHEFAHFELRHTLNGFKSQRTATDVLAWAQVLAGLSNTPTGTFQMSLVGSFYRFHREQETEADLLGMKYLASSSYPAAPAADVWERLMAEADATAAGRKRKSRHRYTAGFFDTHPTELTRATYLKGIASQVGDGGDPGEANFRTATAKWLPSLLEDQIKLNDFGGTEYLLNQMAGSSGWTADLLYARGELYRQRGNPRDLVSAASFYRDAITAGHNTPEAHRNLGLALLRNGQASEAKASLTEYLKRNPDASDASAISMLIAQ